MKNLMVVCPHPDDGTSWYRGVGPMSALTKQVQDLNLIFCGESYNWSQIFVADVVFMQRPFSGEHLQLAAKINACHVPLWIDYDDDLFSVPSDNPAHGVYAQESTQKNVAQLCARADVITVTTEALKNKLQPLNKNVIIVPNAIDDFRLCYRKPRISPRHKLIMWRGSATHERDLMSLMDEIIEVSRMEEFADWKWQFLNYNPWFLTEQMPKERTIVSGGLSPEQFFRFLEEMNHAIQIVPLVDHAFNRSKSNIAWVEGTFAGAAVLAPDLEEWKKPGCTVYGSPDEFKTNLIDLMRGKLDREKLNDTSWTHIRQNLTLSSVNQKRAKIFESLYRRDFGFKT
jgi:O-antigen biosynthesis protein